MKTSADERAGQRVPNVESGLSAPASPSSQLSVSGRKSRAPIVALSQVAPEPLRWLSPGRLAAGKITVLDGDPGLGKSTLLCEFAARITRGDPLPGGEARAPAACRPHRPPRTVSTTPSVPASMPPAAIPGASSPSSTVPDSPASGTPRRPPRSMSPSSADHRPHRGRPPHHRPPGRLSRRAVTTPTPTSGVRRAFHALRGLAERTGVAIVAVRHLNKASGANPLYRGGGSIGIIGAARCGLLLAPDPDDPERRILAVDQGKPRPPTALAGLPPGGRPR